MSEFYFYLLSVVTVALASLIGGWAITKSLKPTDRNWRLMVFLLVGQIFLNSLWIRSTLYQVKEAAGVSLKILNHDSLYTTLEKYFDAKKSLENDGDVFLSGLFEKSVNRFSQSIRAAAEGRFLVSSEDLPAVVVDLIRQARREIIATSYVNSLEFWETPWGKIYAAENYSAVQRGVRVRRVFIVKDQDELKRLQPLINDQLNHGIDVFVAKRDNLSVKFSEDAIKIDNRLVGILALRDKDRKSVV